MATRTELVHARAYLRNRIIVLEGAWEQTMIGQDLTNETQCAYAMACKNRAAYFRSEIDHIDGQLAKLDDEAA